MGNNASGVTVVKQAWEDCVTVMVLFLLNLPFSD